MLKGYTIAQVRWVRSHIGHSGNRIADKLANVGRDLTREREHFVRDFVIYDWDASAYFQSAKASGYNISCLPTLGTGVQRLRPAAKRFVDLSVQADDYQGWNIDAISGAITTAARETGFAFMGSRSTQIDANDPIKVEHNTLTRKRRLERDPVARHTLSLDLCKARNA